MRFNPIAGNHRARVLYQPTAKNSRIIQCLDQTRQKNLITGENVAPWDCQASKLD